MIYKPQQHLLSGLRAQNPPLFHFLKTVDDTLTDANVPAVGGPGGVNLQTTSYAALASDNGLLISFNSASAVALTLPTKPPSSTWHIFVENVGAGVLTINPTGLRLDGSTSSITFQSSTGVYISTDGINYYTQRGSLSIALIPPITITGNIAQPNAILTLINTGTGPTLSVVGSTGGSSLDAMSIIGGQRSGLIIDNSSNTTAYGLLCKADAESSVLATSNTGFGVYGQSQTLSGVYGYTYVTNVGAGGVQGAAPSGGSGVLGGATTGPGGYFSSAQYVGVQAFTGSLLNPAIETILGLGSCTSIGIAGSSMTTIATWTPQAGWIQYATDAKNILDDGAAAGSVAVAGGHGSMIAYVNGSWRILC